MILLMHVKYEQIVCSNGYYLKINLENLDRLKRKPVLSTAA